MQRVGTALIGCGKVATVHAQALSGLPESHFVAVCDADPARSQKFAQRYGVRAYSNVMEMLHDPDVMSHYHELQIQDFLRAIIEDREPAVNGREGRRHVEIFTAIYRSQRDRRLVKFPLDAERGSALFDGRLPRRYQQAFAS